MSKVNIYRMLGVVLIVLWTAGFILHIFQSRNFQIFIENPSGQFFASVYGLLSAVTINPFTWVGVLLLWRADKNEKPDSASRWLDVVKIYAVITLIIFLLTGYFIIMPNAYQSFKGSNRINQTATGSLDYLSSDEQLRFREIVKDVMQNENMPTQEIHQEFWALLNKAKFTDNEVTQLKETMTGVSTTYMKYFYEDAIIALSDGRPYKSKQREDYENKLLQSGLITEFRIKDNENMISQIADGKPIKVDSQNQITFTKDNIEPILANLSKLGDRFNKLFSK